MTIDEMLASKLDGKESAGTSMTIEEMKSFGTVKKVRTSMIDYLDAAGKGISKAIGSAPGLAGDLIKLGADSVSGKGIDEEDFSSPKFWIDRLTPFGIIQAGNRVSQRRIFEDTDIDERISDFGSRLSETNKQFIASGFPEQKTTALKFVEDLGAGSISLAASITMGMVGGAVLPGVVFGASAKATGYKEALDADKTYGEARVISDLLGVFEGGLEFWGIHSIISSGGGIIKRGIKGSVSEFIQEFSQTGAEGLIKKFSGIEKNKFSDILYQSLYAGSLGAVLGGSASVSVASIQKQKIKNALLRAGLDEKKATTKTNELMNKAGENVLGETNKVIDGLSKNIIDLGGKTFEEEQQRSALLVKAMAKEELTGDEKNILKDIHASFVEQGLIEDPEVPDNVEDNVEVETMAKEVREVVEKEAIASRKTKLGTYIDRKLQEEINKEQRRLDELDIAEFEKKELSNLMDIMRGRINKNKNPDITEEVQPIPFVFASTDKNSLSADEALDELVAMRILPEGSTTNDLVDFLVELRESNKKSEAKVADLKPKIIAKRETTILKDKIRNIRRGFKKGVVATKEVLRERIKVINDILKSLTLHDRGKFVRTIGQVTEGDVSNDEKFSRLLDAIEKRVNKLVEISATKKKREKLTDIILKQPKMPENVTDIKYQKRIDEMLDQLGKTKGERKQSIRNMSTENLQRIAGIIANLKDEGRKLFKDKEEQQDIARAILDAVLIKNAGGTEAGQFAKNTVEEKKSRKVNKAEGKLMKARNPLHMLNKIFGKLGEKIFYDSIHIADTTEGIFYTNRTNRINERMKKNKITFFGLGEKIKVGNQTFQVDDILGMYMATKDGHALDTLITLNKISEETVNEFIEKLREEKPEYIKFADEVQEIVGERHPALMQTTESILNRKFDRVKVYFPIRITNFLEEGKQKSFSESKEIITEMLPDIIMRTEKEFSYTSVDKRVTITREEVVGNSDARMSTSFIKDAINGIAEQEHFIAFAALQKAFNQVLNNPGIRDAVTYNHSENAWEDFNHYLKSVIRPQTMGRSEHDAILKHVREGIRAAYLWYNVGTSGKQFLSYFLVAKNTSLQELTTSLYRLNPMNPNSKKVIEEIYAKEPSLKNRAATRDIRDIQRKIRDLPDSDFKRKVGIALASIDKSGAQMITNVDSYTVLAAYDAVYRNQRKTKSESEAKDIALKTVLKTQPQGAIKDLSRMYRTNDEFWRSILMFTNFMNKIWNITSEEIPQQLKAGEFKRSSKDIAAIVVSSVGAFILSHGRLPDDLEEMFDAVFGNFISSIPIIGNLFMSGVRGYDPSISPAASLLSHGNYMIKNILAGKLDKATPDILFLLAVFLKVPYSQLKRGMEGIIDLSTGDTTDLRRLILSEKAIEGK